MLIYAEAPLSFASVRVHSRFRSRTVLLWSVLFVCAGARAAERRVIVRPTDDLAAVIARAADGQEIVLDDGVFAVGADEPFRQGVLIQDKAGLTIRARRPGGTTIRFAADAKFGFYIGSNVSDLTIASLRLEGTPPLRENLHAIGNFTSSTNVRRVAFTGLRVADAAVGISVATRDDGVYRDVRIVDNVLTGFHGTDPGWGYGIHCERARDVVISGNVIEGASRHSIYLARAGRGANVSIERNLIVHHNRAGTQPRWYCAALVCSRASDVRIARNVIVNPNAIALSVEPDEVHGRPVSDIVLLNNRVIGSRYVGIWLTTGESHVALGNTVVPHPASAHPEWCVDVSSFDYPRGMPTQSKLEPPNARWRAPDFVAELDGFIYVMQDGTLDRIVPDSWQFAASPGQWPDAVAICALEDARGEGEGRLYIANASGLHEVDPETWRVKHARGDWSDTRFMAAASGCVYALRQGVLYRVSPGTLRAQAGPDDWSETLGMWEWRGSVYILSKDTCYRIDPETVTGRTIDFAAADMTVPPR